MSALLTIMEFDHLGTNTYFVGVKSLFVVTFFAGNIFWDDCSDLPPQLLPTTRDWRQTGMAVFFKLYIFPQNKAMCTAEGSALVGGL